MQTHISGLVKTDCQMATVSVNTNAYLLNGWDNRTWLLMTDSVIRFVHNLVFYTMSLGLQSNR